MNSILFVGVVTLAFSIAGLIGVGHQEAFQLLWNASGIFYALTYLVMFAIPIVVLSILPIVQVESRLIFAAKISAVVLGANAVGVALFLRARSTGPEDLRT